MEVHTCEINETGYENVNVARNGTDGDLLNYKLIINL